MSVLGATWSARRSARVVHVNGGGGGGGDGGGGSAYGEPPNGKRKPRSFHRGPDFGGGGGRISTGPFGFGPCSTADG